MPPEGKMGKGILVGLEFEPRSKDRVGIEEESGALFSRARIDGSR
jgi:hypothetical protein